MMTHPDIKLDALDNLWFQISGTLCNIECGHCFISCSPRNHSFEFMTTSQVKPLLEESKEMGVKEYYFTGGEPFMNRDIMDIIEMTLDYGPVSVLTNGMLFREPMVKKLAELEKNSIYSLEIRLSMDGYSEEMNDAIRGKGVFKKAIEGIRLLVRYDFLPIITITKTWQDYEDDTILNDFIKMLNSKGYSRPRLKILPSLKIGEEVKRDKGYEQYEWVSREMMEGYDTSQLVCSNSRIATSKGVYVCPILIESQDARLGETLKEATVDYNLRHQACYTCYLYGAICSNFSSVATNA